MKKKIPNRPKTSEIEAVIKNKSQNITVQDQMASLVNSTKYLKRVNINVSQTLPKNRRKGCFGTQFMWPALPTYQRLIMTL